MASASLPKAQPMTREQAAWYLAAMIDGEGCIYYQPSGGHGRRRLIQVTNSDKSILRATMDAFDVLGISHSKPTLMGSKTPRTDCWNIRTTGGRPTYERFAALVPIQSDRKRAKLTQLLGTYIDPLPRPSPEWLREHYIEKRWTAKDMGRRWGISANTIYAMLREVGVPRRSKRDASNLMWQRRRTP